MDQSREILFESAYQNGDLQKGSHCADDCLVCPREHAAPQRSVPRFPAMVDKTSVGMVSGWPKSALVGCSRCCTMKAMRWYQDRATLALIALRYVPWMAGLNLLWEMAHLPLYTLWKEETFGYVAFAVVHCTAGDVLIGLSALAASLTVLRADAAPNWRWLDITAVTVFVGVTYTFFSEWLNIRVLESWSYSNLMPVLELGGTEIGISPLMQWIVVPAVALQLTRREFTSGGAS